MLTLLGTHIKPNVGSFFEVCHKKAEEHRTQEKEEQWSRRKEEQANEFYCVQSI